MRITQVETHVVGNPWKNWVFAKLYTDDGLYGIGEGTVMYSPKPWSARFMNYPRSSSAWKRPR